MIPITKRAMVKKDYKELDETLKAKLPPYLYNGGEGKHVPIAQLTMLRNRDRPPSKQVSKQMNSLCSLLKFCHIWGTEMILILKMWFNILQRCL